MPLLTYAGLGAPKRRNDGKSSNHGAHGIEVTKFVDKPRASNSTYLENDVTSVSMSFGSQHQLSSSRQRPTSHSKDHNGQSSSSITSRNQEQHSRSPFQLSSNTAMRLYNYPHPHRENHQRLSSRRQAPYASAPSSPWKSCNSSISTSTYLCPTMSTQARANGSFSRSQTIQRDEIFGSDSSISATSLSRSTNGGISLSNGFAKVTPKPNRSCGSNTGQVFKHAPSQANSLSRSHEEQSPRVNHRTFAPSSTMIQKQQWLASGHNSPKNSCATLNGSPSKKLLQNQQPKTINSHASPSSALPGAMSSSSMYRKSGQFGTSEKCSATNMSLLMKNSSGSLGKSGVFHNGSNLADKSSNDKRKDKRQSFGSMPPCSSSMSKSDSIQYKNGSKAVRGSLKGICCKDDEVKVPTQYTSVDTEHLSSQMTKPHFSSSLTSSSNGASTLLSSSLLSKVRNLSNDLAEGQLILYYILKLNMLLIDHSNNCKHFKNICR